MQSNGSTGIDPLKQNLDGSEKQMDLGLEVVEIGPTTNFVGNQMTQGAVDMVEALLQFRRKDSEKSHAESEEGPRLLSGPWEVKEVAAQAREINSVLPLPEKVDESCKMYKNLRIVEWKNGVDKDIVLLERPYAEDVSCSMSLSTSFDQSSVSIDFLITAKKSGLMSKRYRREIKDLPYKVDVDRCRCLLGSGTLEELMGSTCLDVANKHVPISHSDDSTIICIVIQKDPSETINQENSAKPAVAMEMSSSVGQSQHLANLKSFIRRTRKA